jgi:hypothetical protein
VIVAMDSGVESAEVDVSKERDCPEGGQPIDRLHLADVTLSAHRIDPDKDTANPQKIESYSIRYIPLTPGSPELDEVVDIPISPEVHITVPQSGSVEEEIDGLVLMSAAKKSEYLSKVGDPSLTRQYKAVYTFHGHDNAGNAFSFGGVGQAEVHFTIGNFGRCEEDLTPPPPVPQNLTGEAISPTQVNLSWDAVTDSDLAGYKVYRDGAFIGSTNASTTLFLMIFCSTVI